MTPADRVRTVLALREVRGIGPATLKRNLSNIRTALSGSDVFESLSQIIGTKASKSEWKAAFAEAGGVVERCEKVGIVALSILDPAYPDRLLELRKPPPVLFCRGNLDLLGRPTMGVIGTRKPTRIGEIASARIGTFFSAEGISICNGLADGIDISIVTHEKASASGVVGVMAAGLDLIENKLSSARLAARAGLVIEANDLLVSAVAPGTPEDQYSVIASCSLQAGLSHVLLLVQSPVDGGSRFTVVE